jgi:hypothetical protein
MLSPEERQGIGWRVGYETAKQFLQNRFYVRDLLEEKIINDRDSVEIILDAQIAGSNATASANDEASAEAAAREAANKKIIDTLKKKGIQLPPATGGRSSSRKTKTKTTRSKSSKGGKRKTKRRL